MVKVVVRENEDFEQVIKRFNKEVRKESDRVWHKRRYGYYEKPSVLRRKRRKMKLRNRSRFIRGMPSIKIRINLETQFRREGPTNAIGR